MQNVAKFLETLGVDEKNWSDKISSYEKLVEILEELNSYNINQLIDAMGSTKFTYKMKRLNESKPTGKPKKQEDKFSEFNKALDKALKYNPKGNSKH